MRITVPGRTELGGNHTDHQGGRVLAAAVDLGITAQAEARPGRTAVLRSAGFGDDTIDLWALAPAHSKPGTAAALCRGVLEYLEKQGYPAAGFEAALRSDIPVGAGLSSSAAYGVLVGRLVSGLFYGGGIPARVLAQAAQYAENTHFGKPCGLMDQCACAYGGVLSMDFRDPAQPQVTPIKTALFAPDYSLYVVHTGGSHQDLTADYAQIPADMGKVASCFGRQRLAEVDVAAFYDALPSLRGRCGDRAVLRALHFFQEDQRAADMAQALRQGDVEAYLRLMDESGRSSEALLQNNFSPVAPDSQGIPLALGLCRRVLGGGGAARVHGGGFAGTIQVLVPAPREASLLAALEPVFGPGSCRRLRVAPPLQD